MLRNFLCQLGLHRWEHYEMRLLYGAAFLTRACERCQKKQANIFGRWLMAKYNA